MELQQQQQQQVIENSYMDFHTTKKTNITTNNSKYLTPFEDETSSQVFGILKIKVKDTPMIKTPQYILFMLDRSQSMSESSTDMSDSSTEINSTKMEQAKHTIKNIAKLIVNSVEECPPVFIQIFVFDDEIDEVVPKIEITRENMGEIVDKINSIKPRNSTNIEKALEKTHETMDIEESTHQTHKDHKEIIQKTEMFLTDGLPTVGDTNISRLIKKEIERTKTTKQKDNNHIYIGYGEDHNGNLLQSISLNKKNGYYYFVDKIENAGLVFGEIMHSLLYPALKNVNIKVEKGEIYDYKTNNWTPNLYIPSILSESEKIYHIRCNNPDDINTEITAVNAVTNEDFKYTVERLPNLLVSKENRIIETDLTKYILRQKTQEYLYHTRSVCVGIENASNTMLILPRHTKKEISEKIEKLREEIKSFLKFLKEFIKSNNYIYDKFYIMLYEDIYIAYKTFGTMEGTMYIGSRQSSQGRQTSYVVSPSQRQSQEEINGDEENMPSLTNEMLSVNTTPKQLKVMNSINSRSRSGSSSPPLISSNDLKLEDMKPLTELDDVMLFNRRNVII